MCKLCNTIWKNVNEYLNTVDCHDDEEIVLVKTDLDSGHPLLYVPCYGDWYYSGTVMECKFCPECGRNLTECGGRNEKCTM